MILMVIVEVVGKEEEIKNENARFNLSLSHFNNTLDTQDKLYTMPFSITTKVQLPSQSFPLSLFADEILLISSFHFTLRLIQLIGASLVTASTGIALSSSKPLAAQPSQAFPRPESVEQHRSKVGLFSQPHTLVSSELADSVSSLCSPQLNLYEEAPKPVILVPEKSPFQDEVAQVRAVIQDATQGLRSSTADGRATWINWERRAEGTLGVSRKLHFIQQN